MLPGAQVCPCISECARGVDCAKLHHANEKSGIFICGYGELAEISDD